MGPLGIQETVFICVLALLVFGPRKLPELGKTIGKAMSEFRRASTELRATFDREMHQIERENESLKEVTSQYAVDDYSYNHDSYYDNGDYNSSGSYDYNTADTTPVSASAPQGADNQADSTGSTQVAANGAAPAGTPAGSEHSSEPAKVEDPQSVKS